AIFRVVAVRQNLHLADRLDRRSYDVRRLVQEVDHVDVVVDAVQQEVVLAVRADAIGGKAAAHRVTSAVFSGNHAGRKTREEGENALSAEWKLAQAPAAQIRAERRALGLEHGSLRRDFNRLAD